MTMRDPLALFVAAVFGVSAHAAVPATTTTTAAASVTATTAAPSGVDTLLLAQAALRAGLAPKCIELSKEAVRSGTLGDDDLAAAWLLRGRCHALDGDADRAERSYAVAARIKPTATIAAKDTIWERVRAEGSAAGTALVLVAAGVVIGENEVGIEVTTQDDLMLGSTIVVFDTAGVEVARAPTQEAATATATATPAVRAVRHRFSGFAVEGTTAKLLDRNGNVLRTTAVELDEAARLAVSASTTTSATAAATTKAAGMAVIPGVNATITRDVGVLGYVGGGGAVAGLVVTAIGGMNLVTAAQAKDAQPGDGTVWLACAVSGVVVMAVGMGLVVGERL